MTEAAAEKLPSPMGAWKELAPMIDKNVYNFHDGLLLGIEVSPGTESIVRLKLSYYPATDRTTRKPCVVEITKASFLSSSLDFDALAQHASFGNISDWEPSHGRGITHLYFPAGMISILGDEPIICFSG